MENEKKEKVIFARDAMVGETYLSKTGIVVKVHKKEANKVILESGHSGNLIPVNDLYILTVLDKKEVEKIMAKKNAEQKVGRKTKNEGSVYVESSLFMPLFNGGKALKVKEMLEKIKVEETKHSPYARLYVSLKKAVKEGLLKIVDKGTFQKVGAKKVSTEKLEPKKEEKSKAKETAKKEEPKPKKVEPKKSEPKKPEAKKTEPKKVEEKEPEPKSEASKPDAPKEEPKPEQPKAEEAKTDGL